MRYLIVLVVFVALLGSEAVLVSRSSVQAQTSAQEKAANLRAQVADVEAKQAELQTRLQALEEKLKPANIESSLAGVGSTHPEDLREQQRRQLEIERNGLQKQLELLNTSHSRLETAIAAADAEAYRQSAAPQTTQPKGPAIEAGQVTDESVAPATSPQRPRHAKKKRSRKSKRA
jgi:chaperonin cofactor prefoldin